MVRLAPDQLAALADMVVERLAARATPAVDEAGAVGRPAAAAGTGTRLMTARDLAEALGVTPGWVWTHADELGAIRLGDGPRPRLRFELEKARAAFADRGAAGSTGERSVAANPAPAQAIRRRRQVQTSGGAPLLPIRGHDEEARAA